jgi:hypothetical protein
MFDELAIKDAEKAERGFEACDKDSRSSGNSAWKY